MRSSRGMKVSSSGTVLLKRRTETSGKRRRKLTPNATEFLAVSHKLANDADDLVAARRHIAGLIRNIDRCLEILKE